MTNKNACNEVFFSAFPTKQSKLSGKFITKVAYVACNNTSILIVNHFTSNVHTYKTYSIELLIK